MGFVSLEFNVNEYREAEAQDEAIEEEENIKLIRIVTIEDRGHDDHGVPNISL